MHLTKRFEALILFAGLVMLVSACGAPRSARSSQRTTTSPSPGSSLKKDNQLRKSITSYAGKFKGAKYHYGGATPKGFDCSGLTHYIFYKFDIELPRGSYNQAKVGKRISLKKTKPGDLVFFGKRGKVNHVALVVRNTASGVEVIHSTSSKGVRIDNVSKSAYWKPRILFARDVLIN